MARQNVTNGSGELVGWFDIGKSSRYEDTMQWLGEYYISRATGDQYSRETLYRTARGRWVLSSWSQMQGVQTTWRYITHTDAVGWLVRCNYPDAEITKAAGEEIPSEAMDVGGRPPIGPRVCLTLPAEVLARVDERASAAGVPRAAYLRDVITAAEGG